MFLLLLRACCVLPLVFFSGPHFINAHVFQPSRVLIVSNSDEPPRLMQQKKVLVSPYFDLLDFCRTEESARLLELSKEASNELLNCINRVDEITAEVNAEIDAGSGIDGFSLSEGLIRKVKKEEEVICRLLDQPKINQLKFLT